jgi:hypothetical protein
MPNSTTRDIVVAGELDTTTAALALCRPKARPWSEVEVNHLLWSIDSNASLALIVRGKTCRWTPELDEILRSAWALGGLRAARKAIWQQQPTWSWYSIKKRITAVRKKLRDLGCFIAEILLLTRANIASGAEPAAHLRPLPTHL